jgi:(1->4)-alpha-D-glucan 1-alpha-D-glucosylmutase
MIPRATYRLQLHAGFTFADAEAIVPYLADLGISHIYSSPITVAAKGSTHGYDVIDPTRINPELGGEAGLHSLVAALKSRDMGLIIDIVPNHMGVAGDENLWWMDVLEKGQASPYATTFDIDWRRTIVLPVLGLPLLDAIAQGAIQLVPRGDSLRVRVHDGPCYPIRLDDPILSQENPEKQDLQELLARQHYELVYWRTANDLLNWRRFFSINELAGVRVEDPEVFAHTHQLFFDLFRDGLIDGVRVDHIDGLADPAAYCRSLRAGFEAVAPDRPAYIVIEKILAAGESLSQDWGVDGTSGYDFMREVTGLLHDPDGEAPLRALWAEISGRSPDFEAEALEARRDLLAWQFEGQLVACVDSFVLLAQSAGQDWLTNGMLRRAIERLLWIFPVYRTYGTGTEAPPADEPIREAARKAAITLAPPGEEPVVDFVLDQLAGSSTGTPELAREAVRRFQQLSAPIAAKGVEDTAFYRHAVLLSANDVGFDPAHIALPVTGFHDAMQARATAFPDAMLATATHDHKRGEDARARLAVLSSIPELWAEHVRHWSDLVTPLVQGIDPADLYQLFQALVGAWTPPPDVVLVRIHGWQEKMLREAKLRSSWEAPDTPYEERYKAVASIMLAPDSAFRRVFEQFMEKLTPAAMANSLAQTFFHYTVPGVPDLYQGGELMDHSTVDPGNREAVDYEVRQSVLAEMAAGKGADTAKLTLVRDLLALRNRHLRLFRDGDYRPLRVGGRRAGHVVAFTRTLCNDTLLCVGAIRLGRALFGARTPVPEAEWWGDTWIEDRDSRLAAAGLFFNIPVHVKVLRTTI